MNLLLALLLFAAPDRVIILVDPETDRIEPYVEHQFNENTTVIYKVYQDEYRSDRYIHNQEDHHVGKGYKAPAWYVEQGSEEGSGKFKVRRSPRGR